MEKVRGKVALVTGASSGIGKTTVEQMLEAGITVYAAARRTERMADLERAGARVVALDVTDDESITATVSSILAETGSIDILINNAGYGSYGAVEDVPIEEARRQFEVNVFGLARLTQLVLPKMRENRYGKIVNISSMGGKVYTPFGGWYHATKHAVEGLTDCLRIETAGFGIDAIVIEPGGIETDWGTIAADNLKQMSGSGPYADPANATADRMAAMYTSGRLSKPEAIAVVIMKAVTSRKPKTRYVAGTGARLAIFVRRLFGDRIFDRLITSAVG